MMSWKIAAVLVVVIALVAPSRACSVAEGYVPPTAKELTQQAPIVLKAVTVDPQIAPPTVQSGQEGEIELQTEIFLQEWSASFEVQCVFKTPEGVDIEPNTPIVIDGYGGSWLCKAAPSANQTYIVYAFQKADGSLSAYYSGPSGALDSPENVCGEDGVHAGLSEEESASAVGECFGEEMICTTEAQICPDGSFVSRDSSRCCAYDPCPEVVCPSDVRICSDGVFVGRNPETCEFEPCQCGDAVCDADEFEFCKKEGVCRTDFCTRDGKQCPAGQYCKNKKNKAACWVDHCATIKCADGFYCKNKRTQGVCKRIRNRRAEDAFALGLDEGEDDFEEEVEELELDGKVVGAAVGLSVVLALAALAVAVKRQRSAPEPLLPAPAAAAVPAIV